MVTVIRPYRNYEDQPEGFTSVSDIGKKLQGRVVTTSHFLSYERLMVGAVTAFLFGSERTIKIRRIEAYKSTIRDSRKLEKLYMLDRVLLKKIPEQGDSVGLQVAQDLVRLTLRTCLWVELVSETRSFHFASDLYVYLAGGVVPSQIKTEFLEMGKQVQLIRSLPYGLRAPAPTI